MIRKIDFLPRTLELELCDLLNLHIELQLDAENLRVQLKQNEDFCPVALFKALCFTDQRNCNKQVNFNDFHRFFVMNGLIIEPEKIDRFFERVINGNTFNFERLVKLVTSVKRQPIIESTTVKMNGFSEDNRRTMPLNEQNPYLEASLLGTTCNESKTRGRSRSKRFKTDYISIDALMMNLSTFIRDQLKIDDELEDLKI